MRLVFFGFGEFGSELGFSALARPRRPVGLGRPRLLAVALLGAAGCSLTADTYEPSVVEQAVSENAPTSAGAEPIDPGAEPPGQPPSAVPGADPPRSADPESDPTPPSLNPSRGAPIAGSAKGSTSGALGSVQQAAQSGDAGSAAVAPPETDAGTVVTPAEPVPGSVATPLACPGRVLGASCYELSAEALAWTDAEARCVGSGGHLARIETAGEDTFLSTWLREPLADGSDAGGAWIGGTDAANDGIFVWSDGGALDYVGWAAGQPDNGAGVDCTVKRNDATALWSDQRCVDALRFVCERPL
jgi:hypothetical protein